ncbi:TetR/AcrR family transcriptional regulator [Nocardia sp. NPDC059246]|uniref:TetR/AcrR family transcriptional regulator n=1 Tax=unclassified Nocardia TaxID=2637762 RepID=UPI0036A4CEE1
MPRRKPRSDGAQTRQEILDAAIRLIARGGLTTATQRKVAVEAEVSLAAITYHFPAAADLIDAALERALEIYLQRLQDQREAAVAGRISLVDACVASTRAEDGSVADVAIVTYDLLVNAIRTPALQGHVQVLVDSLQEFYAPWSPRQELTVAAFSTFLSLNLIHFATGGRQEVAPQIAAMFDLFGITELVAAHQQSGR